MDHQEWKLQQLTIVPPEQKQVLFFPEQKRASKHKGISGYMYPILWCVFLAGVTLGTLLILRGDSQSRQILSQVVGDFLMSRQGEGIFRVAGASFIGATVWLGIVFFCGFCFISQPIILALVLFRGLGYGYGLGMIYVQLGLVNGIKTMLWMFLPLLLFTIVQLWGARIAMLLSIRLLRNSMGADQAIQKRRLKDYCIKFLTLWSLAFVIAVIDGVLSVLAPNL